MITKPAAIPVNHLRLILRQCWSRHITKVVVLCRSNTSNPRDISIFTYFPYTDSEPCETIHPVQIATSDTVAFKINHLFTIKTDNLHQCPLVLATFHNAPYMMMKRELNGKYSVYGFEGSIFNTMASRMNFTPIVLPPNPLERGLIYDNGTVTGCLGQACNLIYRKL